MPHQIAIECNYTSLRLFVLLFDNLLKSHFNPPPGKEGVSPLSNLGIQNRIYRRQCFIDIFTCRSHSSAGCWWWWWSTHPRRKLIQYNQLFFIRFWVKSTAYLSFYRIRDGIAPDHLHRQKHQIGDDGANHKRNVEWPKLKRFLSE